MNKQGKEYVKKINGQAKSFKDLSERDHSNRAYTGVYIKKTFTSEELYERKMRMGIEARVFDLKSDNEFDQVARASLIEDQMK